MAFFKNEEEMLDCFWKYMNSRDPVMKLYKSKGEYVPQPPSIVSWSRFLKESQIPVWEDITYAHLKKMGRKWPDVWEEIQMIIEQEIIDNALVKNYDGNFSGRLLVQKHGWEREITEKDNVVLIGMDALKDILDTEPERGRNDKTDKFTDSNK